MKDSDNADDLVLLANILAKIELLLHSVEQAVGMIGLYGNAN